MSSVWRAKRKYLYPLRKLKCVDVYVSHRLDINKSELLQFSELEHLSNEKITFLTYVYDPSSSVFKSVG